LDSISETEGKATSKLLIYNANIYKNSGAVNHYRRKYLSFLYC